MAKVYDPVKAHEYYMRTRQLKGRTSTAGLSKQDKEMAAYIKEQLRVEMKAKKEKIKLERKQAREKLSEALKQEISRVREQIKSAKRSGNSEQLDTSPHLGSAKSTIAGVREKYAGLRAKITETSKAKMAKANESYKAEYSSEIQKLKAKYIKR